MNNGWLRVKQACEYCGIGERTLRSWFHEGLKHSKVHGTVLIKAKNLDEFLEQFEVSENQVDRVVEEVLSDI